MNPDPQKAEELFDHALQFEPDERAAFLAGACGNDVNLHRRVEDLLMANDAQTGFLADDQPTESAATLLDESALTEGSGSQIGRYKLLEKLGEGGFGSVWAAEQKEPVRRRVALKIIKLGMDTQQIVARFEAERQALALMDHPNIAKVLDAGATDTGRPYFVMELVKGVAITKYCNQEKLDTNARLDLFIKVCQAIQHAHQKGIIHRDIKPSNIMVTLHDGVPVPKVIDFGIAKATQQELTEKTIYTQYSQFIGTPAYMSPEQAEMSGLDIDTRSDIYSLGVLLYELLTGTTPFDSKELMQSGLDEMRKIIREREPVRPSTRLSQTMTQGSDSKPPLATRHSTLASDLDWIVMKCLEKDRTRRYDTANGLATDLNRHLENEPVVARPPSTAYRFQKAFRRNRVVFSAGGTVAAALIIGVAMSVWQAARANRAASRAVAAFDELRAAAPAFFDQARGLAAQEQFDEAIEKLDYALKLRPDVTDYLVAKGDLLQAQLKLAEAAVSYRRALAVQSTHARAGASAKLCDELLAAEPTETGQLSRESLARLLQVMQRQQRPAAELVHVARLLGEENNLLVDYWLARLNVLPVPPSRPLEERLTVREDGQLALDLSDTRVTDLSPLIGAPLALLDVSRCRGLADLSPLEGMPLVELNLERTSVADLTPLREMRTLKKLDLYFSDAIDLAPLRSLQLTDLNLDTTQTSDLSALSGMKLERLNLKSTRVADLSPLAGMPLAFFDASAIPATDFSPLAGAPLEKCILQNSPLRDLSFLRDAPVRDLVLFGCNEARGFSVLQTLASLKLLALPQSYRSLPEEDLAAIGALRNHPTLQNIQAEYREIDGLVVNTAQSKNAFWEDWDREQAFLPEIRAAASDFSLQKYADGTYALTVNQQPFFDLSILKGVPISELSVFGCNVSDLTPLRDMPLWFLNIPDNPITDLSPLQGKKIGTLYLARTSVADLAPLKSLPLQQLYLDDCQNVTNVAALAEILTLRNLVIPLANNIEALKNLPNLQRLGFHMMPTSPFVPETTAEEFWRKFEANRWIHALLDLGITVKSARQLEDGTWEVNLDGKPVTDLELLRDAPISILNVGHTQVADLSPLRGMPLRQLHLYDTRVSDLSPLEGMRLDWLNLYGTQVTDLSVLRGMPLVRLRLHGCPGITDLSPLAGATTLQELTLPPNASDFEFLRAFPHIERLGFEEDAEWKPNRTAAAFWQEFENQNASKTRQP